MKHALTLGTAVAAGSLPAVGAIINVDFAPAGLGAGVVLSDSNSVFIDLDTGGVEILPRGTRNPSASELQVSFITPRVGITTTVGSPTRFGPAELNAKAELFAGGSIGFAQVGGSALRYGYGAALTQGAGYFDNSVSTEDGEGYGNWGGGFTGLAFVGFQNGANEGWLAINYQAGSVPVRFLDKDPSSKGATGGHQLAGPGGYIELLQLQYGNAGEQLDTPSAGTYAIPEPAAAGALLAGSAALFALRRRRKS
jgi:hypothetical protein